MRTSRLNVAIVIGFIAVGAAAMAQNAPAQQPTTAPAAQEPAATTPAAPPARGRGTPAPTRDPQTPGYVAATMLADGAVAARRRVSATSLSVPRTRRRPR